MSKRLKITAYTDGACKGNPGRGGWGVAFSFYTKKNVKVTWTHYGGKMVTTNQEMELTGFLEALDLCPKGSDITVYSDSSYVLSSLVNGGKEGTVEMQKRKMDGKPTGKVIYTGWLGGWIQNGWKKKDGKAIKHVEIWKNVAYQCESHLKLGSSLKFIWVKGHSGDEGNELADKLANIGVPKRN